MAHVRAIRPDDSDRLVAFHGRLSPETVYRRFFGLHPQLSPTELRRFTHVDYHQRLALVAEHAGQLIAVARYERLPGTCDAEVAFVVSDAEQGRGLATLLLEHLAAAARSRGIARFVADTLATNSEMIAVFGRAGFDVVRSHQDGLVRVEFPIETSERFITAVDDRDRVAERRSIQSLLCPRSIAVVGASARAGGVGHAIFNNIIDGGYVGAVHPVNRRGEPVAGRSGFTGLAAVPGPVDLVVVAVGPEDAIGLVADASRLEARGLLVISAGFAESGPDGAVLQRRLLAAARDHGMRVIGPNTLGLANTAPEVSLNATFSPAAPVAGPAGLLSQSGAVGIVALEQANSIGLGISSFVSVGNKSDVSGNDLLEYWQDDPATEVVCLYLESFGNPRRFARLAQRLARTKPIVAVKSGRTDAGRRAASSHTAAAASSDVAVDALFARAGVIRVDTLAELFDTALVLADQPLPAGGRVAIVGNAGGPGILAADACGRVGLELPELGAGTQQVLRGLLPAAAAVANPVDMLAAATGLHYREVLAAVLADPQIDAVIAIYIPPLISDPEDIAAAVADAVAAASTAPAPAPLAASAPAPAPAPAATAAPPAAPDAAAAPAPPAAPAPAPGAVKPVVACFLGTETPPVALRNPSPGRRRVPCMPFPERAAQALARALSYRRWRERPEGIDPHLDGIDQAAAQRLVAEALARAPGGGWLDAADAWALLAAYGIPAVATHFATSVDEAVTVADTLGYPVALKAASGRIVHKSDVGGVHLGLADATAVRAAFGAMSNTLGRRMGGAIVQPMAGAGVETIVGVVNDDSFGPLVMFGLGGVATDLLGDRAFRSAPLSDVDAAGLIRSLRTSPLLTGYRGSSPVDLDALEDIVLRAGRLAHDLPEVAELDLNPVIATPTGALVADAKVRVTVPRPHPDPWLRRLR
jgi:acyl-CoA synthetase (NDP forming)/GNAT superfamily N-acetyltransferase